MHHDINASQLMLVTIFNIFPFEDIYENVYIAIIVYHGKTRFSIKCLKSTSTCCSYFTPWNTQSHTLCSVLTLPQMVKLVQKSKIEITTHSNVTDIQLTNWLWKSRKSEWNLISYYITSTIPVSGTEFRNMKSVCFIKKIFFLTHFKRCKGVIDQLLRFLILRVTG